MFKVKLTTYNFIARKQDNRMKTILTTHLLILMLLLPVVAKAQFVTISGNVINSKSGKALENVNIFESSSNTGTITDEKGFFKLILTGSEFEIIITDSGFKKLTQQIVSKNDTILTVKLEPEIQKKIRQKKQHKLQTAAKTSKR